jgi:hypothetical protein
MRVVKDFDICSEGKILYSSKTGTLDLDTIRTLAKPSGYYHLDEDEKNGGYKYDETIRNSSEILDLEIHIKGELGLTEKVRKSYLNEDHDDNQRSISNIRDEYLNGYKTSVTDIFDDVPYKQKGFGVGLKVFLQKMLIYEEGGKFEPHLDRKLHNYMSGTIVLPLNDDYTGGELLKVEEVEEEIKNGPVFIDIDTLHRIKPITSGTRIVLVFKTFYQEMTFPRPRRPQGDNDFID